MQDPNEDTEWNDILRKHKIIPPKPKPPPVDDEIDMTEPVIDYDKKTDEELKELEDDLDEEFMTELRNKRIAELKRMQQKAKFGEVIEITGQSWKKQVNEAGEDIVVIVHLYNHSIPLCKLLNQHFNTLAKKFPEIKFVKGIATTCVPNMKDAHLPAVFVYKNDEPIKQFLGALQFGGMSITCDELEWKFSQHDILKSNLKENPKKQVDDYMMSSIRSSYVGKSNKYDDSSDDDY